MIKYEMQRSSQGPDTLRSSQGGETRRAFALNNKMKLVLSHRPERALRLRRQLMAIYSYLLLWGGTVVGVEIAAFDPRTPHLVIFGALVAVNVVVFALVRSGFTERFKDPSLTMPQMFAGIVVITLLLFYARELRGALLSLYLITMTFGVFSLDRGQQIIMAVIAQLAFTVLLTYEWVQLPLTQILAQSVSQWGVLALILAWFVYMGGYIHNLQQRFRTQRESLRKAHDRLASIAIRDELTDLYNRRHFLERLEEELSRTDREHIPLHIAVVDLDHFKRINDTYGHPAGDEVLKRFAALASQCLRRSDVLARYGGEEFVVLFPHTSSQACLAALERLRHSFSEQRYAFAEELSSAFSAGLTHYQPGESAEQFIKRADNALYEAKHLGRNRIQQAG